MFDSHRPQDREAIMRISRTSDTRQRHRIDGVATGHMRSIAPQNSDTVFDTVKFGEVHSRLARARGCLESLQTHLCLSPDDQLVEEAKRICRLCYLAAVRLETCLTDPADSSPVVPSHLRKGAIIPALKSSVLEGKTIGFARHAIWLIVKNPWDYAEMMRRGLVPTERELRTTMHRVGKDLEHCQ